MGIDSTINLPESYTDLDQTLNTADLILSDAVANATTLFHTPVISSIKGKEVVSRVMVLREFNLANKMMRFHTDYRAAKIKHFTENNNVSVIGYDPDLKIQIKLQGKIRVHYDDEVTESAWRESNGRSKKCYSIKDGSELWNFMTENPFIKSKKKLSLVISSPQLRIIMIYIFI